MLPLLMLPLLGQNPFYCRGSHPGGRCFWPACFPSVVAFRTFHTRKRGVLLMHSSWNWRSTSAAGGPLSLYSFRRQQTFCARGQLEGWDLSNSIHEPSSLHIFEFFWMWLQRFCCIWSLALTPQGDVFVPSLSLFSSSLVAFSFFSLS